MQNNSLKKTPIWFSKYLDSFIVFVIAIGIWFYIPNMLDYSFESGNPFTNPLLFPKLISIFLIMLSVIQIVYIYIKSKKASRGAEDKDEQEKIEVKNVKTFIIGLSGVCIYVLLLPLVGFLIATIISSFGFIYFFGKPKWYKALIFSLSIAIIIQSVFNKLLNVPLPTSIFL